MALDPMEGVNAHFEVVDAAWMSADELRLYVSGILRDDDSNGYDLYELSRPVPEAAFGVPENLTSSVNTPFVERMPRLSGDETLLVFESDRTGNGNLDLFVASRAVSNLPFDLATPMDTFNTLGREDPGWLNADGSFLYFNSGDDLYVASPVAEAAAIDELNTAVIERYPIVTADGLFLYFARDNGPTNTDIHVAKRNSTSEDFGPATPLSILNSAERDFVSWVSADHCTLILGSDRTAGGKLYELFIARRAPLSP